MLNVLNVSTTSREELFADVPLMLSSALEGSELGERGEQRRDLLRLSLGGAPLMRSAAGGDFVAPVATSPVSAVDFPMRGSGEEEEELLEDVSKGKGEYSRNRRDDDQFLPKNF